LKTAHGLFFAYQVRYSRRNLKNLYRTIEADATKHDQDAQEALGELIILAEQFCEIKKRTGRTEPTVNYLGDIQE